jgi:aryl-alcohol dehydrogenase-like predicted oxidoreductase
VHAFRAPDIPDSRLLANELGGGGILDVGCYCVSGARLVAGVALGISGRAEPIDLEATGHVGVTGVDDWAKATLRFDGGIVAELSTAVRVDEPPRLEIIGTEGSILLNEPWLPDARGKAGIVVRRKGRLRKEVVRVRGDRGLYAYQADVLADAVAAGRTQAEFPAPTWDDTVANMRTLDRWRAAVGVSHPPDLLPAPVHGRAPRHGEMATVAVEGVRLPVSRIALGTMVARDLTTTACQLGIFDAYFEAGGNTFDTAFIYADGDSENALGRWMSTRGVRDQVVVIAKGAHTPDNFPDRIRPQLERSLERMATDRADLYFLHRDNPDLPAAAFVDALEELRRGGLIDAYGGSNWTSERIDEANAWARERGAAGFTSVSNQFSLARMNVPTYEGTLGANTPAFREWLTSRGMTNFAWSSQASGFFAGLEEDGFLAHAWFSDDNLERRRRAVELAETLGVEPVTIALAWVLRCGYPVVPIAGPRSLAELRTSLDALDVTLEDEQVRWLDLEDG